MVSPHWKRHLLKSKLIDRCFFLWSELQLEWMRCERGLSGAYAGGIVVTCISTGCKFPMLRDKVDCSTTEFLWAALESSKLWWSIDRQILPFLSTVTMRPNSSHVNTSSTPTPWDLLLSRRFFEPPCKLHVLCNYYSLLRCEHQAENTLYNVYQHTLQQKSQFFASLLSLPGSSASEAQKAMKNNSDFQARQAFAKANGLDGKCDEKALLLPHTVSEVDELLGFIYNQHEWVKFSAYSIWHWPNSACH